MLYKTLDLQCIFTFSTTNANPETGGGSAWGSGHPGVLAVAVVVMIVWIGETAAKYVIHILFH